MIDIMQRIIGILTVTLIGVGIASGQGPVTPTTPTHELDPTVPRPQPIQPSETPGTLDPTLHRTLIESDASHSESTATHDARSVTEELLRQDPAVLEAYRQVLLAKYAREAEVFEEQRSMLRWTDLVGRVIFVVVHIITLLGLAASTVEFSHAWRTRSHLTEVQEVRVSLEGIALRTTLHGIMLMGIALAFYFLYLKFVFPVTLVGS